MDYSKSGNPKGAHHNPRGPDHAQKGAPKSVTPPRETIYGRIDARVDPMIKTGALDEARTLWARGLERDCPAMRAHGMPGFCDYFDGRASLEDAVERCKRDTRRYAKRQMTWIAHQFTLWPRIPSLALDIRTRVIADLHAEAQNRVK